MEKIQLHLGNAQTIEEVIAQLDRIIEWSVTHKSRIGYFAALYRKVTVKVREGILNGMFEDGPRMERLDVVFANRYLDALQAYFTHQPLSECWRVSFEQARYKRPIILQHLLIGMNAHINLDLGIAAATVAPGPEIMGLQGDFNKINSVLAALVDEVEAEINALSPWIKLLDSLSPDQVTDAIVNFSMARARDAAWEFAVLCAPLTAEQLAPVVQAKDKSVTELAWKVAKPYGWFFQLGLWVVSARESRDVRHNVAVLNEQVPQVTEAEVTPAV